ncbi:hypothetical protein MILUP08_44658 [Micromonospora lupini str. Lupac 08]|uniref:Uncharacterized protein n=1 Tax=Micromonospora lupini str. Lupac 08 TaxID=1150864 RepID=I0L7I4_9ACTN|nr:hypothetical protein MILUP08_44658 [Micromonospora lupini str. Lupac 08]
MSAIQPTTAAVSQAFSRRDMDAPAYLAQLC